jgi:ribosome-associated protein
MSFTADPFMAPPGLTHKETALDRTKTLEAVAVHEPSDVVRLAAEAAVDKKGIDPIALDVSELLQIVDTFLIVSGSSRRQVSSLVDEILERVRAIGVRPLRTEGVDGAEWVLLDYGDVVVHVFLDEVRRYYELERLWGDAPRQSFGSG